MEEKCENCRYYERGYCHRYPQVQKKNAGDFCGEYTNIKGRNKNKEE